MDFIHKYHTIKCQHLGKYPLKLPDDRTGQQATGKDKEKPRRVQGTADGTAQDTGYKTIGQEQAGHYNIGQDTGDNNTGQDSTGKDKGPEQYRGMMERKRQERTDSPESHDRTAND